MAHGQRASRINGHIGKEYFQKRRGMKCNCLHSVSDRPGTNKLYKRYTHKLERIYDKNLIKKELEE